MVSFDGTFDVKVFSDLLLEIDDYFHWYNMSDELKIRFARIKLEKSPRMFGLL